MCPVALLNDNKPFQKCDSQIINVKELGIQYLAKFCEIVAIVIDWESPENIQLVRTFKIVASQGEYCQG